MGLLQTNSAVDRIQLTRQPTATVKFINFQLLPHEAHHDPMCALYSYLCADVHFGHVHQVIL